MAPSRDTSPSAYQEVFVNELRARREASGLSRNKLAAALGCTPQWLAKVETFEKPPSEGLADDLDTYFELGGTFRRMWMKHQEARKRGLIPTGFRPLISAEKEAAQISIYEPVLITGLFQTEEYARLVFSKGPKQDKIDDLVAIRMERQAVLTSPKAPMVFLLIRESVLRDVPSEVRGGQCKRLLDLAGLSNVSIQVLPACACVFEATGFQILTFGGSTDVAYVEGAGGNGQMLSDATEVQKLAVLFNLARSEALSASGSAALIQSIMEDT
ncbi:MULTISPECIES: helix-turn-helix domain-containing protein [Actinomadura]|uniref:Helix-turn-helix domain-containing protein n=1 Tax=Actinomadura madurae TaxID=1993 RepID=A0A1I5QR71_9ACTN|nr:helix-turn-helix transcriptional regulator [Actinomadura madurae]SFP48723.1 Helix-turn-helix domain-containing protein [Actinomadura madurae]